MISKKKFYGDFGEFLARRYLKRKGYKIIEKNYTTTFGEIDIIAKDGYALVFVEVKTRRNTKFGVPINSVDYKKREKLTKLANYYLVSKQIKALTRFDVIEVIGLKINHIKGAFYAKK